MVRQVYEGGKTLYACSCCGYAYDSKQLAEKCEAWCKSHDGHCNAKIMEKAVMAPK